MFKLYQCVRAHSFKLSKPILSVPRIFIRVKTSCSICCWVMLFCFFKFKVFDVLNVLKFSHLNNCMLFNYTIDVVASGEHYKQVCTFCTCARVTGNIDIKFAYPNNQMADGCLECEVSMCV